MRSPYSKRIHFNSWLTVAISSMFFDNTLFKERNLQLINAHFLCISILKTGVKTIEKFHFAMAKITIPFFFLDL